jgi:hypothetical protein
MTEAISGQDMLPADFPEPVLTCDLIIEREIKDAISQFQYWRHFSDEHWKFERGDKSDAAMAVLYKSLMHLQAYIGAAVTVDLLRTIQGMAPGLADDIARQFDWLHESGESGELLWDWAIERGLDPESITDAAKAEIEKRDKP